MKGEVMSDDVHIQLAELLTTVREMFSMDLPELKDSTEKTLAISSRDINLSRLLRERGLVRLYRLLKEKDSSGIPLFMAYVDPYSEETFKKQEHFIGWIAKDAHIPRSTLFLRFSTYDKMLGLDFGLEEAFQTIITKPYAMRKVLNMTAEWNKKGLITGVDPTIAKNIANKILSPEEARKVEEAADYYEENPTPIALQELVDAYRPALKGFVEELAEHTNTKDMMEYVQHDIIGKPEITYSWKDEALIMSIIRKAITEDGTEVVTEIEDIPFIPDYPNKIEDEILDDLFGHLPIKNRREVMAERERLKLQQEIGEIDEENLPF